MKKPVILGLVLGALACTRPNPTPMPVPPPPPEPTALETLLADLDPGSQGSFGGFAPDWWMEATKTFPGTPDAVGTFIGKRPAFKSNGADLNHFDDGIRFVTAVTVLERAREAGSCDNACELGIVHVYHVFAQWSFMDASAIAERIVSTSGLNLGPKRESFVNFCALLIRKSPQRFRGVAVELLRRSPESPEAITALRDVVVVESRVGNYAIADRAYAEVMTKLGDEAAQGDLFDAARVSFRAGNVMRGHDYVARAKLLSDDKVRELTSMEAWATEAGRLEHATDYEDRVHLDELYMKLERHEDVRRLSGSLIEEHADDARPVLYYGHDVFNAYDLAGAATIMRSAGPEHRTVEFYQFTIGISCAVAMNAALYNGNGEAFVTRLREDLPRLRQLNDEYMKLEPARAEWIGMAFDFAQVALLNPSPDQKEQASRLRTAVDSVRARTGEDDVTWPDGDYYGPVRLICAMLDSDQKRSRAAIADVAARHGGDPVIARLTRSVLLFRALMWKDSAGLDALIKSLQASSERADRQFVLEVSAIRTDIKNAAAWEALGEAYQALGSPDSEAEKKRYANNLGVMRYRANRKQEAHDLWFASGNAGTEYPAALVNLYATEDTDRDALWQALRYRLGVDAHLDHVAKAWTIRFTAKDKTAEKKQLQELAKNEEQPVFTPYVTPNVGLEKTIRIEIGFGGHLETIASLEARPWLLVEP